MITAKNPILSGFYPDPSVCAVGEDYYLVNSTFAYFPGVPIFHSRDLAHWEQIGHVLDRPSQLPLDGCGHSEGIFAPTIRYYDGTYYMITTNVSAGGNFLVTARDPKGPWSDPYYLDAPGIDPSLFFDENGACYYVGTRPDSHGPRYVGDWEVWCQKLDLTSKKLTGESHVLWKGALKDTVWPEGPHLYKKDGYYYLLIAEGGTGPEHCITIARSQEVFGPYEGNRKNPIITHRHLGSTYPVVHVGHGDLVQAADGNWYMVMLASRPCEGYVNLGRETFLAKVVWEDGWPVVNPGVGRLEETLTYPGEPVLTDPLPAVHGFEGGSLPLEFVMLRGGTEDICSLTECKGALRLHVRPERMNDKVHPAYVAIRQQYQDYQAEAWMEFEPGEGEEAGLCVVQSNEYHIRFVKSRTGGTAVMRLISCKSGEDACLAQLEVPGGSGVLRIINRGQRAKFCYDCGGVYMVLAEDVDMRFLSTETAGGFVGCTIGMYASSNGADSGNACDFRWFACQDLRGK